VDDNFGMNTHSARTGCNLLGKVGEVGPTRSLFPTVSQHNALLANFLDQYVKSASRKPRKQFASIFHTKPK
jgi:hypothetical protein